MDTLERIDLTIGREKGIARVKRPDEEVFCILLLSLDSRCASMVSVNTFLDTARLLLRMLHSMPNEGAALQ